jgi:hypothetical protein
MAKDEYFLQVWITCLVKDCPWAWVIEVVNRGVLVKGFVVFFIYTVRRMAWRVFPRKDSCLVK